MRFKLLPICVLIGCPVLAPGQGRISGRVTDLREKPLPDVILFLKNTLDGGVTDSAGRFDFTTQQTGVQVLLFSYTGISDSVSVTVTHDITDLQLRLAIRKGLTPITISAGSFEVSNDKRTVLRPMDIMSTAGAGADISRAIETLPGVQQPGAETGLFVRGGDAGETAILVDGMVVQNAFLSAVPGVSQSTRFSPFQFKGIAFSSGGYGARYGQALSSVLELKTTDVDEKDRISLGANVTGVFVSGDNTFRHASLGVSGYANDLRYFYGAAASHINFTQPPQSDGLSFRYADSVNRSGIVKVYLSGSRYTTALQTPDPFLAGDSVEFGLHSHTFLSTSSYQQGIGSEWTLFGSASYSWNQEDAGWSGQPLGQVVSNDRDRRLQFRWEVTRYLGSAASVAAGVEWQGLGYYKAFDTLAGRFTESLWAPYLEMNWTVLNWLAIRPGVRYESSRLLAERVVEPRLSVVFKLGDRNRLSFGGGRYDEDADSRYLLAGRRPKMEEAIHVIADWEWDPAGYILRVEGYSKNYRELVRELNTPYNPTIYPLIDPQISVDNSGYGYARGAELFFRDKRSIKGFDYWISYSYIDSKRLYRDFVSEATPVFVSRHNLNLVGKYFVEKWQTNFSLTYTYGSGRPYYDPAETSFLRPMTPAIQDLAMSVGRLGTVRKLFTVLYLGIDNVTNHHNVFGYRYSADGLRRYPILPAVYRSVIVGFNISLSRFNKSEL